VADLAAPDQTPLNFKMGSRQYRPEYVRGGDKVFPFGRFYDNYFPRVVEPFFEQPFFETPFEELDVNPRTRAYRGRRYDRDLKPAPRSILDADRRNSSVRNRSRAPAEYDSRPVKKPSSLPFGKAMRKLFDQLEKAAGFYSKFQDDFDNDTTNIKKYALERTMIDLWVSKLIGKRGRRDSGDDKNENDDDEFGKSQVEEFDKMKKGVTKVLQDAVDSDIIGQYQESRWDTTRKDTAIRLQEKVETANEQILDLLESVMKGREHCVQLLNEIDLLKKLIDPEDDKNKVLHKGGGENTESGGGGEGGQAWSSGV